MPLSVSDIATLQQYLIGVMGRADHHAHRVNEIALALVGAIVWRKDATAIKVMAARNGGTANVLWISIGGKRYAFSYNHDAGTIEMRDKSVQGDVLASFDNSTPIAEVRRIFSLL